MKLLRSVLTVGMITSAAATGSYAGPYTDDLSKCLVDKTTAEDRVSLVQWMFMAASRHPAVSSIASVTEQQLDEANHMMADLAMRLLTESCREEARKAVKYEGEATLNVGFGVLGQVAGKELFGNPEVQAAISTLEEYMDEEKLKSITEADKPGDG